MRILILVAVMAAFALSACGNRGSLDRPPPLWGGERAVETVPAAQPEEEDLFADEDEAGDGLPAIPGQDPFADDDWDD
ncbi:MAG: LPS translocon maturation chaperone LptM [Glycocaulis sp.]